MKGFLQRADAIALLTMILFSLTLLAYAYLTTRFVNYALLFLCIIGLVTLRGAQASLYIVWKVPPVEAVERAERIAFWAMSIVSFGLLTFEYAVANSFNHYLFLVFIIGLLAHFLASALSHHQKTR
ncbi:MAG: hypothetical protein ACETWE_05430 [Candidatus Bathyarchaeia archaeon]